MGHDIYIVERDLEDDEDVFDVDYIDRTYVSFNWSSMNLTAHHFHGRTGHIIAKMIIRELDRLKRFEKVTPRDDLGVDGWGQFNGDHSGKSWRLYEEGDKEVIYAIHCMYACILEMFLKLAQRYPDNYWYSDQSCGRRVVPPPLEELAEHGIFPIITDSGNTVFRALHPLTGVSQVIATQEAALEMAEYENKEGWTLLAEYLPYGK